MQHYPIVFCIPSLRNILNYFYKFYFSSDDLNSSNDTDNDEWLRGIGISPRKTLKIARK